MINVNKKVRNIARLCHEANRVMQISFGEEVNPKWDELSEDLKDSTYIVVLEALNGATPEDLHESWLIERRAQGWTYGYPLDRVKKIHPNLIPYDELALEQKLKDAMFWAMVANYRA